MLQVTSVIDHKSIKIILKIPQTVEIHSGYPAETEQLFLVVHAMFMKDFNGLIGADTAL